jgi:hypothetical protein
MIFPELKVIGKITFSNVDYHKVKLDWSKQDVDKVTKKKDWLKNHYTLIDITKEQSDVFNLVLDEYNWEPFLYPLKYQKIFDTEYLIPDEYLQELKHLEGLAIGEWQRARPFDTVVRERLLHIAIKSINCYFYLLEDCYALDYRKLQKQGEGKRDVELVTILNLFRFWKLYTGGGLLIDKASENIKSKDLRKWFEDEVKEDLIENINFKPLGIDISQKDKILNLIQQKIRDNKLKEIGV